MRSLFHLFAILLLAVWWGGFTFYSLVVVPTGHQVLHSKVRQGFITQRVTDKLNLLGAVTLAVLLGQMLAARRAAVSPMRFRVLAISWGVMAVMLATLCWLHPHLDALLDPASRTVTDDDHFYELHRWYLIIAGGQWVAGGVHFTALLLSPPAPVKPPVAP